MPTGCPSRPFRNAHRSLLALLLSRWRGAHPPVPALTGQCPFRFGSDTMRAQWSRIPFPGNGTAGSAPEGFGGWGKDWSIPRLCSCAHSASFSSGCAARDSQAPSLLSSLARSCRPWYLIMRYLHSPPTPRPLLLYAFFV
jgi:hypothetical protein